MRGRQDMRTFLGIAVVVALVALAVIGAGHMVNAGTTARPYVTGTR
jgi:hypothetical protein